MWGDVLSHSVTMMEHGVPWEFIEEKIIEDLDNTFDDEKFVRMNPDFRIDAAYARKEFGDQKLELVDYLLRIAKFVTKSEYVDFCIFHARSPIFNSHAINNNPHSVNPSE